MSDFLYLELPELAPRLDAAARRSEAMGGFEIQ